MRTPTDWASGELERLEALGLRRRPVTVASAPGPEVSVGGRSLLLLGSNDYLGLAADPRVVRAAVDSAGRWGAGAGASRLVSGTTELHLEVERDLAAHEGCDDAVLFSSGYLANLGTIAALVRPGDAVLSDELNHASIVDACRLSGARVAVWRHADPGELERLLSTVAGRRRLVVTDTVFSMDGDLAPLPEIAAACRRHGAMLMVDEAHATGLLGPTGAGAVEAAGLTGRVDVVMGTLSKALGSAGGYVAGRRDLIEYLRNRARTYVFDTAPAPAAVGAAREALRIARAEPARRARALALAHTLAQELGALGYAAGEPAAAVVPVMVGDAAEAFALSARLREAGVLCPAIRPPSVPPGTARLRVTATAAMTDDQASRALDAFARARPRRAPGSPARPVVGRRAAPGIDLAVLRAGGVFLTGTGTGVGKTVVAAALVRTLAGAGLRAGVMKPAQTGAPTGKGDASFVARAAGLPPDLAVTVYDLPEPLAPVVAARRAGVAIDPERVAAAFRALRERVDAVVVEGAGGLLVPLTGDVTMGDLVRLLGLPVVVVATPSLGTLNHTALTVEAARSRRLEVLGVVLSGLPADPGPAEATNPGEIERLCGVPVVGAVPLLEGLDVDAGRWPGGDPRPWLAPALGGTFDRARFLEGLAAEKLLDART